MIKILEEKELLLKDLCARLPYKVKFKANNEECIREIHYIKDENVYIREYRNLPYWIDNIKPYLCPMSSMTEEEIKELLNIDTKRGIFSSRHLTWHLDGEVIDYLNKKMFDWRELIPKGLALEAPEGMYNINKK